MHAQDAELDELLSGSPDFYEFERNMRVPGDDVESGDDDNDEDNSIDADDDMDIERDIDSTGRKCTASSSTSSKNESNSSSSSSSSRSIEWLTQVSNITLPFTRARHHYGNNTKTNKSPLQILQLFISIHVVTQWVAYTNKYASVRRMLTLDTDADEMYAFIGVHVYMGIHELPELGMYWSDEFKASFISQLFSRHRFECILSCFCTTDPISDGYCNDPEMHTVEFRSHLNNTFFRHFKPSQHLTFDESMAAFTARAAIKQYIPNKPHPFGYKFWCLSSDNYLLKFDLYAGKSDEQTEHGHTHKTVMGFASDYANKNYTLYMDSFFTSTQLLRDLARLHIAVCGSVRLNRKGMPPNSQLNKRVLKSVKRGQSLHFQRNDMCVVIWRDVKVLKLLYNHIQPSTVATSLKRWGDNNSKIEIPCPQAIHDYFYHARAVDVLNQLRYSYTMGRKAMNAMSRIVWWLIDICVVNAYTLHRVGREEERQLDFRLSLMHELVESFRSKIKVAAERAAAASGAALATDHYTARSDVQGYCAHCSVRSGKRVKSKFVCAACDTHLCIGECFKLYHM
jgi:hypothetical protein